MIEIQDHMLIQYLIFVYETEDDQDQRDAKILKAVADYMLGRRS